METMGTMGRKDASKSAKSAIQPDSEADMADKLSCKQGTREMVGKELMVADARLSCFSNKCPRYRKVSLQSANVSSPQ